MRAKGPGGPVSPAWFDVALQALALLAHSDHVCPSAEIAEHVHTHAVFLRRIFAQLVRARIVEAREGRDGGYRLSRPADQISLADVYRALKAEDPTSIPLTAVEPDCFGTGSICIALDEIAEEVAEHIIEVLERHTLAALIARTAQLT